MQDKIRDQLKHSPFITKRQKSSVRLAHGAELDDITGALALLATITALYDVEFAAANFERLLKYDSEKVVVNRRVKADAAIQSLTESLNESLSGDNDNSSDESATGMKAIADSLDRQMSTMNNNIQKQLYHLNAICLATSTQHSQIIRHETETKPNPPDFDRSLNVVISGVDEDKYSSLWRKTADKVLHHMLIWWIQSVSEVVSRRARSVQF